MQKLLTFFFLLLISSAFNFSFADEADKETNKYYIPKKRNPVDPGAQLKPAYNTGIGFKYIPTDNSCVFTLPADIEYIDIEAENLDLHIIYMGSVWAENPVWNQELPTGEYIITCTADNGDVYEGYIYI